MLIQHVKFLANVNVKAAYRLANKIQEEIITLKYNPKRTSKYEIIKNCQYRRLIINKKYLVIYFINQETIYIDYIFDCRRLINNQI